MFEAQLLITKSSAYSIYGPWFPAGGDDADFQIEVIAEDGDPKLTVEVLTKTKGLAGDGGSAVATFIATGTGLYGDDTDSSLKDLVRYKYTIENDTSGSAGDWMLFRMKAPRWFNKV